MPWFVIGIIHEMEAGLKFTAHLHNGDPLTARTSHEPVGRPQFGVPPFEWEDSAIDALVMKKLGEVKLWTIERIAYQLEAYNGWGYRTRDTGIHTPYLWSATSNYKKGKFVRDRVFNPDAVSRQIGAMALLRRLIDIQGVNVPVESDVPEPDRSSPPSDANLPKQLYPGVVVCINHPDPAVVMLLQRRLNQLGCWPTVHANGQTAPLMVDGDFGSATLAALKLFQARSFDADGKALTVDGVAGQLTWAALFAQAPQPEPKPPHTPIPLLSKVLEVAGNELQVREAPLGSNRGPRVDEYLRAAGIGPKTGSYPWCAGFIVWCFENAARSLGVVSPVPRTAGVHDMWQKAGRSGFGRIAYDIAMGDSHQVQAGHVFFIYAGGGHGHVGLVTARQGADFRTIEGNTTSLADAKASGCLLAAGLCDRRRSDSSSLRRASSSFAFS